MAIEIVSFPLKNGGSFHSYVSLPEGNYERCWIQINQNRRVASNNGEIAGDS